MSIIKPPSVQPRRNRKLWYSLPIIALLAAGGLWLHFHRLHQSDNSPIAESAPWALQTTQIRRGSVTADIQSVAVIEAPSVIVLSPQIQGIVRTVGPRVGVAVHRGELLVRIDARSIARNLAALQKQHNAAVADAEYATKQQVRIDAVLAEGGVSQSQGDQAHIAAQAATAKERSLTEQVAALRVQLGYAEIRAPRDSVVAQRLVQVGDTVAPGRPVYRLTAGRGAVVRVSLPADRLAAVHKGDLLELRQGDARVNLPISRIAPAVDAAGLGTVEADTNAMPFDLPSGSMVMVTVHSTGSGDSLTVPIAALVGRGSGAHVVVFTAGVRADEPGRLRLVPVQVLQEGSNRAAVRGKLQPGERVVIGQTAVLAQLRDGDAALTTAGVGAAR